MIISIDVVRDELSRHNNFISVVELAMILEANASEVRHRLHELGDRVTKNDDDEWRVVSNLVHKLELSPLSEAEIQERDDLENTVQQAFLLAGQALKTLREKKLYRETHSSFISYVKERFDFTRRAADYLISACEVIENLKREQIVLGINVLPSNESQCRELARLPIPQQAPAWVSALEEAGEGKAPPARIVKQIVSKIKGVEPVFNRKKKDGPVLVPGIGIEYTAVLDEETYWLLKKYMEQNGKATLNGAVRKLLDERHDASQD